MVIISSPLPAAPKPTIPFHETILDAIRKHSIHGGNKIAFVNGDDGSEITFQQVHDNALSVATYLKSRGFEKDVACAVLPNTWHYAPLFLGVARVGGATSGASALFTDYELQRQFTDSKAKAVCTTEIHLPKVMKAAKQSPLVKIIIVIPKSASSTLPSDVVPWDEVIKTPPIDNELPKPNIDIEKDIVMLPYSSGTTGAPKGVMLSHSSIGIMISIYARQDADRNIPFVDPNWNFEKEKALLFLPFYHVFGFGNLMKGLLFGSTGVVLSHFEPANFCSNIAKHKIRMLALVPPIMVFLAKHPITAKHDLSSIQYILSGAAPAGKDICEELSTKFPNIKHIRQGYGMTECSMASHFPDLNNEQPLGSVGKLMPNLEMKMVDIVSGAEVSLGERGEVCLRGPTLMLGYLDRPDATNSTIIDGWLHTGDIGYVDQNGNLFIVDRLKEIIKVKGLQVAPAELEDILLSHPRIRDAAVIGIPNNKTGELPKAFIVRADETLTEQEVKEFVKAKVSAYKQLAGGVEFIQEIPKSATGKILRRKLKDRTVA